MKNKFFKSVGVSFKNRSYLHCEAMRELYVSSKRKKGS